MSRSFSLSEAAKKAKEQRNIWSFEYQNADARKEAIAIEPSNTEDFTDGQETAEPERLSDDDSVCVLAATSKPRVAKPVKGPGTAQGPKPVLRPKSTSAPMQQTAELAVERQQFCQASTTESSDPVARPLERKTQPFNERYERITTYLEKPLFRRVHDLHQRGEIAKIAGIFNAAVRDYLDRYYPDKDK
ncbi:hypothetical protein PV433_11920 [Paenibacillus sp. GYB004]|uniref:hypothetical protein n=1 Tax=Paenibacillus sp. GYB004 TaxID=2994393 RepID=UPI002F965632